MRKVVSIAAALVVLTYCAIARAADAPVTLQGDIVCAKCTLKVADQCQNVLLVKNPGGNETQYWLAPNPVAEAFGEVCSARKPVAVSGSVTEKDGRKWIEATKIDPR